MKPQQWAQFMNILTSSNTGVAIMYGTSECQLISGCHSCDFNNIIVPIGYPLPNVHCILVNENEQVINPTKDINEIGQIYAAGRIHIRVDVVNHTVILL